MEYSISPEYHNFVNELSQTTMFDEYIRGKISSLGINIVGINKDGELHLTKMMSKMKRESLSSTPSTTSDDSVFSNNYTEKGPPISCCSVECDSKTIMKKDNEAKNISKTNIDGSKGMKEGYKTRKLSLPTPFQSTTSFITNFFPQQDQPDNTSSTLTERDNVPKAKREKEVCQVQKTYGSDKQKLAPRRSKKISI